ncbi:MAG: hypothetical protein JRH01_05555 [Deltaproteobacteria bacterium]|nr:hypothetical protein [Deltaproteobacteria bacterium]MBW2361449.1 hypothetical protein [Deltaproteobacteria bacterium]
MRFKSFPTSLATIFLLAISPLTTADGANAQDHGDRSGGVHSGRGSSHDQHSGGRGGSGRGRGSGQSSSSSSHHVPTAVGDDSASSDHDDTGHDSGGHDDGSSHTSKGKQGGQGQASAGRGRGQGGGAGRGASGRRSSDDPKGQSSDRGQSDAIRPGGRPVWAQEGLPEIELGRLNVARAPSRVLDRALAEAVGEWSDDKTDWYGLSLEEALARLPELEKGIRVESPLGNLGMYRSLLSGQRPVPISGDALALAALFLGAASDKTIPIVPDTVVALNTILGVGGDLSSTQVSGLAGDADRVRAAILEAHGDVGEDVDEGGHGH